MSAFNLGGIFTVYNNRSVVGNVFVGEVNHNVFSFELLLKTVISTSAIAQHRHRDDNVVLLLHF